MDRLQHPTADPNGLFRTADPVNGIAATRITADHMNAVLLELVNAIEASGLNPDSSDLTQLTQAISRISTSAGGLKNQVINGGFQIWQRGNNIAGIGDTPVYTADRFEARADGVGGSGIATVTKKNFVSGQDDVPGALSFLRYAQDTGSDSGGGRVSTKLEVLEQTAGGDVTVSCWMKATAAITVNATVIQNLGQSEQNAGGAALALSTEWQQFTFTVACPSLVGQTFDPLQNPHLRLEFAMPLGTPQVDIAQVQLERSSVASSFELRPLPVELALCQRYYEKTYPLDVAPGTVTHSGIVAGVNAGSVMHTLATRFRVPKRTTPTMGWYAPTSSTVGQILAETGSVVHGTSLTLDTSPTSTGRPQISSFFSGVQSVFAHWTADAEL